MAATATAASPPVAPAGGARLLFRCQGCAAVLDLTGAPEDAAPSTLVHRADARASPGETTGAMDESFMVLPATAREAPETREPGSRDLDQPLSSARALDARRGPAATEASPASNASNASAAEMAESFVVLPRSVSRVDTTLGSNLNARVAALARVFDMASDETQADHPLCLECAARLRDEIDARAAETEAECEIHRRCLEELEREAAQEQTVGDQTADERARAVDALELEALETEEETRRLEAELETLDAERAASERASRALDEEERTYFHDLNAFQALLRAHVDERDMLVAKVEQTNRQLERLRRVNVFNDAFHIWFDGPFGTVNGFRLGRLPNAPVEWDEINAAWGMACLLLSTMAQAAGLTFQHYTLKPLGSFSKVRENGKGVEYELYGPVNILSSHRYDKAMTGFLSCLKEFAEFARESDLSSSGPDGDEMGAEAANAFKLPYDIDGDKIDGRKIGFPFNRYERWTAALKITLVDLKACLAWLANQQS